jgi:DnaJ-class molecular chaperone
MKNYLDHTHPDAFVDHPKQKSRGDGYKECPRCKGHGGWNLELNAYNLHGRENTPENRHVFSHFRSMCGVCNGYGYIHNSQTCEHDWKSHKNVGRCLNEYICIHCSKIELVDSSD